MEKAKFLGKNLRYLRKQRGLNQDEMQAGTGIARSTWSNYEKDITEPNFEGLIQISSFFGVSIDDLLRKDMEIEKAIVHLNAGSDVSEKIKSVHPNVHPNVHLKGNFDRFAEGGFTYALEYKAPYGRATDTLVPVTELEVAAGGGIYNDGPLDNVEKVGLGATFIKPGHTYLCVRIKGVSMAPTLQDGGYVVIRLLDKSEWAKMPDERVFVVIDTDGKAYLKRVKNRFKQGFIVLRSDSPDQATYPSFNLASKEITAIWYVEWYFSAKLPNIHDQFYTRLQQMEDRIDILEARQTKINPK